MSEVNKKLLQDISHHNNVSSFAKVKQSGIFGIIHKATRGTTFIDPTFPGNKKEVEQAGLHVGAYHFGIAGDPVVQAAHFVSVAGKRDIEWHLGAFDLLWGARL